MHKSTQTMQSRKGVTLLFTISMIVLFLLMGTTFVVVANDYFKSARRRSQLSTYKVNTAALLDRAFYDVFRGPSLEDSSSSLRTHSILEDQYGYGYRTTIDSVTAGPIAALRTLTVSSGTTIESIYDLSTFSAATEPDGFFGGCVLTFTTGAAEGYSCRIVTSFYDVGTGDLRIVIPTDQLGIDWSLAGGSGVIINGRDFAGQGAGTGAGGELDTLDFDTATVTTSLISGGILTPNQIGETSADLRANYIVEANSTNESYDVADENNWFLAGEDIDGNPIPSFHRDRIYEEGLTSIGRTPDDIRSFSFRPIYIDDNALNSNAQDNPGSIESRFGEFYEEDDPSGSGAYEAGDLVNARNSVNGLDVDSDGDGTLDAVWIDIGLPIQTDEEGRQFKPLVAYRIVDMDSRLNLNVHGSYADEQLGAGIRRGSSFGVAEVSLRELGGYGTLLDARSGSDPVAGNPFNLMRAESQTLFGYPGHTLKTGGLFASGADVFGINTIGRNISIYGNDSLQGFTTNSTLTSASSQTIPYAANLGIGGGAGDSLFQPFELEALLRSNDSDAGLLISRLRGVGSLFTNKDAITTESAEIAMPPYSIVERLWDQVGNSRAIYRELIARSYLSEEMLMGGLYDLNQPVGNGVDDGGAPGTIDDHDELATLAQDSTRADRQPFEMINNSSEFGGAFGGPQLSRQRKATQLYILALLVSGSDAPAGMTTGQYRTSVAQWAVNIVDFIDSDSIMTAFEFDIEPFNAVYVDGNPETDDTGSDDVIVFGAERPELLITENFCLHDRRNQDLDSDNGDGETVVDGDDDWDSTHFPESSLFIELYNPWTQLDPGNAGRFGAGVEDASQVLPAELYAAQPSDPDFYGVDLTRTVADSAGSNVSPVWRIGVKRDRTDLTFLRAIFFTDLRGAISTNDLNLNTLVTGDNFFTSYETPTGGAVEASVVEPGRYYVLGSSGNVDGEFRTTLGRPSTNLPDVANTRSIALSYVGTTGAVTINDPGQTHTPADCDVGVVDRFVQYDGTAITIAPTQRSLSLSDPNGGYEPLVLDSMEFPEADGTQINPPLDAPLDDTARQGRNNDDLNAIWTNGVTDNFRVVHLQRLADPTRPFDATFNPYITIDTAEVDLLAFNGLNNDPSNTGIEEQYQNPAGGGVLNVNGGQSTALTTSERGENRQNIRVLRNGDHIMLARRTFFRTADYVNDGNYINTNTGANSGSDLHNLSFSFFNTDVATPEPMISLGKRNISIGGVAGSPNPLGELVWLNRPLANSMELAHVPLMPNGGIDVGPTSGGTMRTMLDYFNLCRSIDNIPDVTTSPHAQDHFVSYFADDKFGHLMGFGGMSPAGPGGELNGGRLPQTIANINDYDPVRRIPTEANRFDVFLDFVNVPPKFQGLRTWLPGTAAFSASPVAPAGGMFFNLRAPFNSLPSFREPGKINLNTMFEDPNNADQSLVFRGIIGKSSHTSTDGFVSLTDTFDEFRDLRNTNIDTGIMPDNATTDFQNLFLPVSRSQFTSENPRSSIQSGMFRRLDVTIPGNPPMRTADLRTFDRFDDADANTNTFTSSWYENEFRQRLGSVATTRSSVFSIWITVGYFEVDQYGRLGAEIGAEEGEVRRNRAFYMVDRSIPVASEPGRNHNVDQAVLVRTIIE